MEDMVKQNFQKRNNIGRKQNKGLKNLLSLIEQKKIVVCKSDKDGKIVIVNYEDYTDIVRREMEGYSKLKLEGRKLDEWLTKNKKDAENMILKLYESGDIDDKLLYCSTGIKRNKNNALCKITGPQAKHFANLEPGYIYPLFKTHKLNVESLLRETIKNIPVRLVQSSGNSYLSRTTALLEFLLKPVAKMYCRSGVNEYCKDSEHYLTDLMQWKYKTISDNKHYRIVAADVKALYPNLKRDLVQIAVTDALQTSSQVTEQGQEFISKLVMFCLDSSVIKFQDKIYQQKTGIVTGENNSVTIANIALHYIVKKVQEINTKTKIFRRFIDDIIFITDDSNDTEIVKSRLSEEFGNHELELTYREVSTEKEDQKVEFLDVLHHAKHDIEKNFFVTDFVKPTAVGATFLHGKSAHPSYTFKGIILGEAKRLRRLNEKDEEYKMSIERLKEKCLRSEFNRKIATEWITRVGGCSNVWSNNGRREERKKDDEKQKIPWATSFGSILKQGKEKELGKNTMITYRRPPTIGGMLTRYKKIAFEEKEKNNLTRSAGCKKCGLCGNFGKLKNMVENTDSITTKNGKTIHLKQRLSCNDHGIYAAQCLICKETYIGQTCNSFSKRWNTHRQDWKKMMNQDQKSQDNQEKENDNQVLFKHYQKMHKTIIKKKIKIWEAYSLIFVERPDRRELDTAESFWIDKTEAKINKARTALPCFK